MKTKVTLCCVDRWFRGGTAVLLFYLLISVMPHCGDRLSIYYMRIRQRERGIDWVAPGPLHSILWIDGLSKV